MIVNRAVAISILILLLISLCLYYLGMKLNQIDSVSGVTRMFRRVQYDEWEN